MKMMGRSVVWVSVAINDIRQHYTMRGRGTFVIVLFRVSRSTSCSAWSCRCARLNGEELYVLASYPYERTLIRGITDGRSELGQQTPSAVNVPSRCPFKPWIVMMLRLLAIMVLFNVSYDLHTLLLRRRSRIAPLIRTLLSRFLLYSARTVAPVWRP